MKLLQPLLNCSTGKGRLIVPLSSALWNNLFHNLQVDFHAKIY